MRGCRNLKRNTRKNLAVMDNKSTWKARIQLVSRCHVDVNDSHIMESLCVPRSTKEHIKYRMYIALHKR